MALTCILNGVSGKKNCQADICFSCEHTFSSCENLYKHYKTFTNHCPREHLLEAARKPLMNFAQKPRPLIQESQTSSLRKSF